MAHKRNGKQARAERQERARDRVQNQDPGVRLLQEIFGVEDVCSECGNGILRLVDCQSPHCKALRGETSVFYDQVTTDAIYLKGGVLEAGIDY